MSKIMNPFIENFHSYNGKLHEAYTTSIYNITYDTFQDNDCSNMLAGYVEPNKIIDRAREIVFDFDYSINNESIENKYLGTINLKDDFEKAFIRKYLTDEIAYESFTLWKAKLIGKLEETIPMLNLRFNLIKEITPNDLRGGYIFNEHIENKHDDTNTNKGTVTNKNTGTQDNVRNNVGSEFPVNDINAFNNLGNVDYASTGIIDKHKRTDNLTGERKDDLIHQNDGGYTTDKTTDKLDRDLIEKISKMKSILDNYITDYLKEFQYLFLGIL